MRKFLLLLIVFSRIDPLVAQVISSSFSEGWQFRKAGETDWHKAEVPGCVHTDLLLNHLIPDPFYRDNEKKVRWVEREDWEYKTIFSVPPEIFSRKKISLVFDGLDIYANVFLNGQLVLEADNMFRQWKVETKSLLKRSGNELRILFRSAVLHDDSLAARNSIQLAGENNRMYSRKAQYQYGWDWGPRLVTCGIWKPVRWEAWDEPIPSEKNESRRWNVELVNKPDSIGRSFYFSVNGRPTFIKGANWIPCESFLPAAKKKDLYKKLLLEAKEAHINMLRVWGGGVYEDDQFYDLCDRYGIMVWQDFMFAGALYPGDEKFLKNVEAEVRYQVLRLRHHPCIVLWCGNNEIDEAWHNWGWQQQYHYSAADSMKLWNDYQNIFQQLIPGILKELDPLRPYWPSSPSIGWGRGQAYREGDVHYWGVWWGKEPVEKYKDKVGRFNSEYGMQAFPGMETIRQFALPGDLDTSSPVMKTHQKHPFGYPNIKWYIENKFRTPKNFEDLVYVSQLMQADAIATAIEAHRRSMPYSMGTLFWQWNDCWPVVSWSAVDYFGRKKALAWALRDLYGMVLVSAEMSKNETGKNEILVWVVSDSLKEFNASLNVEVFDITGNTRLIRFPGKNIKVKSAAVSHFSFGAGNELPLENTIIRISLQQAGREIASRYLFPGPPRELDLVRPHFRWKILGGNRLELITDKFAYGVFLDVPAGVELSDNFFHLMPGTRKILRLGGHWDPATLKKDLKIKSLADTY